VPCVDGSELARAFFTVQRWSVRACVRPVCAVHMIAGHNALRGSAPGHKPAYSTMRRYEWGVLTAGSTGSALRADRPPNLYLTPAGRYVALFASRPRATARLREGGPLAQSTFNRRRVFVNSLLRPAALKVPALRLEQLHILRNFLNTAARDWRKSLLYANLGYVFLQNRTRARSA
jgi:hypothetical protein